MRKLFIVLLLLLPCLTQSQNFWVTDPRISGKLTFQNGWTLTDTTTGLKINSNLWVLGPELFLGGGVIKDSAGVFIFNKPLVFRSLTTEIAPWITNDMVKDSTINGSKIKKGTVTFNEIAPSTKDSIFGSTNVGTLDISYKALRDRVNVVLDSKGDFKPSAFNDAFVIDTLNNQVKLDTNKILFAADTNRFVTSLSLDGYLPRSDTNKFITVSDTLSFLTIAEGVDSIEAIVGRISTATLMAKSDSTKFWRKLEFDTANYISKTRTRTDTALNNYFISVNDIMPYATIDSVTTLIDQAVFTVSEGAWTALNLDTSKLHTIYTLDTAITNRYLWHNDPTKVLNRLDISLYPRKTEVNDSLGRYVRKSALDTLGTLPNYYTKTQIKAIDSLSNYYKKTEIDVGVNRRLTKNDIDTLSSLPNFYTKTQVKATDSLTNYYTKTQVKSTDSLTNYYKKSEIRSTIDSLWYKKGPSALDTNRFISIYDVDPNIFTRPANTLEIKNNSIPISKLDSSKLGQGLKYNSVTGDLELAFTDDTASVTKSGDKNIIIKPKLFVTWSGVPTGSFESGGFTGAGDLKRNGVLDKGGFVLPVGAYLNRIIISVPNELIGGENTDSLRHTYTFIPRQDTSGLKYYFPANTQVCMKFYSDYVDFFGTTIYSFGGKMFKNNSEIDELYPVMSRTYGGEPIGKPLPIPYMEDGYLTDFTMEFLLDE